MNRYSLIIEKLKEISKKQVIFSYENELLIDNRLLLEGRFLVNLENISTETISINHRKEKTREILIIYNKFNNTVKDNLLSEIILIEDILDKLIQDEDLRRQGIFNIEYSMSIDLEKENTNDISGVVIFNINLTIKER